MANVDPNYWFLDSATVTPFRTPHYTSANTVQVLIDGKEYMDHLSALLSNVVSGDIYYFTAWRADRNIKLTPDVSGSKTYGELLQDAITAGVDVRGLLWYVFGSIRINISGGPNHSQESADIVTLLDAVTPATQRGVLDRRLPSFSASHHQKSSVISAGGDFFAYVGGIDVAPDRWDTQAHDNSPHRTQENFEAWHDVQAAMQGPSVAQVYANFSDRWNDSTLPHDVSGVPGGTVPPPVPPLSDLPTASPGSTHHVQLLRTIPCGTHPWLPDGEQTVRLAYEKAISLAEHYIYIEDQYAWNCSLATPLKDAADRGVHIIVVLAHEYETTGLGKIHNNLRYSNFLDTIRSGTGAANLHVYHLKRLSAGADIYVHSKLMIVDDCIAFIGSANVNLRSHTTDTELGIAVVDADTVSNPINGVPTTVCRFARDMRTRLWEEHLGMAGLDDPIASLASWPTAATPQVHHACFHEEPFVRLPFFPRSIMNLETVCD